MRHLMWFPLLAVTLLSGCISVYKTDTQQGNLVTQEMLDKIKPGMTRSQVRFALGTPLVVDPFHPNRWEYYFYFKKGGADTAETHTVTVFFENDTLTRIEGSARTGDGNTPSMTPASTATDKRAAPSTANSPLRAI